MAEVSHTLCHWRERLLFAWAMNYLFSPDIVTLAIDVIVVVMTSSPAAICHPLLMLHQASHIRKNDDISEGAGGFGATYIGYERKPPDIPPPSG